ncbi:hypothetical protein HWV62_40882 [Athelia sp. TMB]|nr:hypothetical protein HWV62_40882 [Athelia sp. TMB]
MPQPRPPTMLAPGVKITWMVLCTVGTCCSWPVLWAMTKAMNVLWIPVTYGVALTAMIFCFDLGMIWHLNPYEYPRWFCLAQMFVTNICTFVLIGLCVSFYIATIVSVLWPQHRDPNRGPGLRWHNAFYLLVVALPAVSTTLQMYFALTLGADRQAGFDGTFCDVTEPLWPKLLGYGGLPLLFSFPCAGFMFFAVRRLSQMLEIHKKLWVQVAENIRWEAGMRRRREAEAEAAAVHGGRADRDTAHPSMEEHGAVPLVRMPASPDSATPCIAFPSPMRTSWGHADADAETSHTGKRALHPSFTSSATRVPDDEKPAEEGAHMPFAMDRPHKPKTPTPPPLDADEFDGPPPGGRVPLPAPGAAAPDLSAYGTYGGPADDEELGIPGMLPPPKTVLGQIWRLLLFQGAFFVIGACLSISTLYSLAAHRGPREFGSDHVAGIFTSWAPVIVFGHSPGVRKHLVFWRKKPASP